MFELLNATNSSHWWIWTSLLIPAIHLLGILQAVDAVMHMRSTQGAVAWAITLILFPYFALPAYWAFGPRRFKSYKRKISSSRASFVKLTHASLDHIKANQKRIPDEYISDLHFVEKIADWPLTRGNKLEFHPEGEAHFRNLFEKIKEAQKYVFIHFYIINEDETGQTLKKILIEKAASGIPTYLMYDQIGSLHLSSGYLKKLEEAGVHVSEFRTNRGLTNRFRLNFRNHRKLAVVDGKWASVGGHNLGDIYRTGKSPCGHLQDMSVTIEGPAVLPIQRTLAQDWYWANDDLPKLHWEAKTFEEDVTLLPIATGPIDEIDHCLLYILNLIRVAKSRLWLTTPYFTPDDVIMSSLQLAALRGVDVQLIIPHKTDLFIPHLATRACARELSRSGARVFEYSPGFIHQKLIIVDDQFASVGSANLDNRSLHLNFEQSVLIANKDKISELDCIFSEQRRCSHEISSALNSTPRLTDIPQQIAKLFSPVL